ncbi:eukaryotic translation initiation factor 2 subunit beta [Cotonvirus japonicus]|uniref:Eukaryotic translation initiation factor 2 subunit beta n=1 Tax=Cotonvirus japonicus TaxID=2811091 RepID=A0ABM7NSR4_9VIRU|nr:eukaryotic translation initiation factor 2 subunit beta [Cotonvirus japonicus]BCS83151.1 eukaryotic translation initiation factor 2 subunit beta [Cotonvirus japonicus]
MELSYTYEDLLTKLTNSKTSDDIYKKVNLPSVNVSQKNRSSIIANFNKFPIKLNRDPTDIAKFFKEETGITNSINERGQLIIQGSLSANKCESIIRNYISKFVMCRQCKSTISIIMKDNGLNYLVCKQCQAKTSLGKF